MLYKVTPMMPSQEEQRARKVKEPGQPRKRRKTAIYDAEGHEVLITLMCLKCKSMKPLAQFGLRKMSDGAIRNQPWCRTCRGGAGVKKRPESEAEAQVVAIAPDRAPVEPVAEPVGEASLPVSVSSGTSIFDEPTEPAAQAAPAESTQQVEPAPSPA